MSAKLTIVIMSYNNALVIKDAIISALAQEYPMKEVVVLDDCSTDDTVAVASKYPQLKVIKNERNLGIGGNITKAFEVVNTKYILFLCADDILTNTMVASDVVKIFDTKPDIGVIDRYYYQFLDGYPGAVMVNREKNILISSINPSGMAFRNRKVTASNRIFIEMPSVVAEFLKFTGWTRLEYDTVAVRLQPLQNTGCKSSYYKESPIQVLTDFYGEDLKCYHNFIQLKNRAPKILWREICLTVKLFPRSLQRPQFWFHAIIAVIIPGSLLRPLSNFYRHRISRRLVSIIPRS